MHIVSNIRNLDKFLNCFPLAAENAFSEKECAKYYSANDLRAHHYDLVVAKVVSNGATITESRDGKERELLVGEWMIAPLVGRESTLGHSSVLPSDGIAVGAVIDYISTGGGLGISVDNPPNTGNPTKVKIMGILRYEDGQIARSLDFALDMRASEKFCPVIAVVGSCSGAGKTTATCDIIKNLHENGKKIGVAKLSGTAQRKEILELAVHANQWLDTADAGMPTTYPPSQGNDERTKFTVEQAIIAAERTLQELSNDNDIIVVEFGGDLLSASVPEILADPSRLNIVALVMVAESATAAIGMETKLHKISKRYQVIPEYVVGPSANLQANRNRVKRETDCAECYDLWNKSNESASQKQIDSSIADTKELIQRLLERCN
jgi:Ni2+-binding GTPase involved in maturation of urease and hydrogenase